MQGALTTDAVPGSSLQVNSSSHGSGSTQRLPTATHGARGQQQDPLSVGNPGFVPHAASSAAAKPAAGSGDDAGMPPNGRILVYGDSNCLDMNKRTTEPCYWLMLKALEFLVGDFGRGHVDEHVFANTLRLQQPFRSDSVNPPKRPVRSLVVLGDGFRRC